MHTKYLTEKQAAELLNVPARTLAGIRRRGLVPFTRIGRAIRYDPSQLERWSKNQATSREPMYNTRTTTNAFAIHSRSTETPSIRRLAAAACFRCGLPEETVAELCGASATDDELRYGNRSMFDIVRDISLISGQSRPNTAAEFVRSVTPTSMSNLSSVFTTAFNASLLEGYENSPDVTYKFCEDGELPNYQKSERIKPTKGMALSRHVRGGTAKDVNFGDEWEEYAIAKYSGRFTLDEMDLIDDRFGQLGQAVPREMGEAAAQIRPNLVAYILIGNPNMRDGDPFFVNGLNRLPSSAFTQGNLKKAITTMGTFQENGQLINAPSAGYVLLTGETLSFDADQIVNSATISNDSGEGSKNSIHDRKLTPVSDARLDVGVVDPYSEGMAAGIPTSWFLLNKHRRAIEVGYLAGTRQRPVVRNGWTQPGTGEFKLSWDVTHSVGAKAIRRLAALRSDA